MYFGCVKRKAKKRHKCAECGKTIIPNQTHIRTCYKTNKKVTTAYLEMECYEALCDTGNINNTKLKAPHIPPVRFY